MTVLVIVNKLSLIVILMGINLNKGSAYLLG